MRPVLLTVGCFFCLVSSARAQEAVEPEGPEAPSRWGTFTATPEYVLWWLREGRVPPLLTTSSTTSQGRLGEPDTHVLYGGERIPTRHDDRFNGVRLTLEWTSPDSTFGVEARGFVLERDSTNFKATSDGSQLLALPYTDAVTGQPASRVIAGQDAQRGPLSGGFVGYSRIEWFGEEVNAVLPLPAAGPWGLDLLGGARFFQMRDRFHETGNSWALPSGSVLYSVMDNIRVANAFYGAQVGLRGDWHLGDFSLRLRGTIAVGGDDQQVRTYALGIFQTPQVRQTTPTGLYVQPSNSGSWSRFHFDGAGELAVNAGYQLTHHLRLFAGYTFLYWADPLRAGDQVDTVVNAQQGRTPAPARPSLPFKGDALWAQGVNAGVELQW
jgi:Putative beta barrel porin-7 (BBP7)